MIKIVIVEDNETIREGLAALINGTEGYKCSASYVSCEKMLDDIKSLKPDVMLMDIELPGISGIEGVKKVKEILPDVNILMLSIYEENERIFDALCAGACGYLIKKTPPARLIEAIREANDGGSPMSSHIARKVVSFFRSQATQVQKPESNLSERETDILKKLAEGNSYQTIAEALFISIDTVRYHIRNIYKKLQVHSQSEAVAKALRKGFI